MKRFLAFALIIASSISLLLSIQFVISKRDHWTYSSGEITCGNCSQDGIVVSNYDNRAAIYSLENSEIEFFWILNFLLSSTGIVYVILSKFGKLNREPQLLENLNKENEIIRKQIEKRELLAKLENLEKK